MPAVWSMKPSATRDPVLSRGTAASLQNCIGMQESVGACDAHAMYTVSMSKMIQLRNVPDSVHRTLKARAALAGMSLSDYLIAEIRQLASRPTMSELRERVQRREPVTGRVSAADIIREERDRR